VDVLEKTFCSVDDVLGVGFYLEVLELVEGLGLEGLGLRDKCLELRGELGLGYLDVGVLGGWLSSGLGGVLI
jgi:hypothetical protein